MLKYDPEFQLAKDYKPVLVELVENMTSDERKLIFKTKKFQKFPKFYFNKFFNKCRNENLQKKVRQKVSQKRSRKLPQHPKVPLRKKRKWKRSQIYPFETEVDT